MDLGNFSVSLTVKDLAASRAFYAARGFEPASGDGQHMQIMRNRAATIGLFQGMFDRNILTFNPGWDADCNPLPAFTDVRDLQRRLRERAIDLVTAADESTAGARQFHGRRPRRQPEPRRPTPLTATPPPKASEER